MIWLIVLGLLAIIIASFVAGAVYGRAAARNAIADAQALLSSASKKVDGQ